MSPPHPHRLPLRKHLRKILSHRHRSDSAPPASTKVHFGGYHNPEASPPPCHNRDGTTVSGCQGKCCPSVSWPSVPPSYPPYRRQTLHRVRSDYSHPAYTSHASDEPFPHIPARHSARSRYTEYTSIRTSLRSRIAFPAACQNWYHPSPVL